MTPEAAVPRDLVRNTPSILEDEVILMQMRRGGGCGLWMHSRQEDNWIDVLMTCILKVWFYREIKASEDRFNPGSMLTGRLSESHVPQHVAKR